MNNFSFIETSTLDSTNVETTFIKILTRIIGDHTIAYVCMFLFSSNMSALYLQYGLSGYGAIDHKTLPFYRKSIFPKQNQLFSKKKKVRTINVAPSTTTAVNTPTLRVN